MFGLRFEDQSPIIASDPNRADIACFVGFVERRATPLPAQVARWLSERQWIAEQDVSNALLNLPTPVDTWDSFDRLFAWERRPLQAGHSEGQTIPTYLGAAVRSFFAQGGRKCYVVRAGDPWPYLEAAADPAERKQRIKQRVKQLLPGFSDATPALSAVDITTWQGVGQLFGLPDVAFVALPDLADIVRSPEPKIEPPDPLPSGPEQFVECAEPQPAPPQVGLARRVNAPRCDATGYALWAKAIALGGGLLSRLLREVQLVAALPLPAAGERAEDNLLAYLNSLPGHPLAFDPRVSPAGFASAFVQLAYPWVRTAGSANLPEALEPPEGVLTGLLARNALLRGAFHSAAGLELADVHELFPILSREQLETVVVDGPQDNIRHTLAQRISLLGQTPNGPRLLSDVTTSLQESYRQAHVDRLLASLIRAARRIGEDILFEPAGERLWRRLRTQLNNVLQGFLNAGALRGQSPQEAYQVRCDRSTMTQNDIDSGRVIVQIQCEPAAAIETITIALAMDEGGRVSLLEQA